jgi:lysophospholipase L1-like esterase
MNNKPTKLRSAIFQFLLICLPITFFILLEVALRLFHYGGQYSLFVEERLTEGPARGYYAMNPEMGKLYFRSNTMDCLYDLFLKNKTDSTFRIFVQGESSALGFPYKHSGSFSRLLQARLAETFPNKHIEVINTAMTAVSSYTLLDISDDIIKMKPDAVLIYAGHNEFYGALGVGSTIGLGSNPAVIRLVLKLRRFRTYQLLENLLRGKPDKKTAGDAPLMRIMAKDHGILAGSKKYNRCVRQFGYNLHKLLYRYNNHGIPVFVGTLVCNVKGQKPFVSNPVSAIAGSILHSANSVLEAGDTASAFRILQNAYLSDTANAVLCYRIATLLYRWQNFSKASYFFDRASDLDLLKFRAPKEFNRILQRCGHDNHAYVVDLDSVFSRHSEHGIVGDELMVDHLHPNIKGYHLMADAFYDALKTFGLIGEWKRYIGSDEASKRFFIPESDSIYGEYIIAKLKARWPFRESEPSHDPVAQNYKQETEPEKIALDLYARNIDWYESMRRLYDFYIKNGLNEKALRICGVLGLEYGYSAVPFDMAGSVYVKEKKFDSSLSCYAKAFEYNPSAGFALKASLSYVRLHDLGSARRIAAAAMEKNAECEELLVAINDIQTLSDALRLEPKNVEMLLRLAKIYHRLVLPEMTEDMLKKVLAVDPENKIAKAYFAGGMGE